MANRKYAINREVFFNEDEVSFYLLGAVMSDGVVTDTKRSKYVGIGSKDLDWLILIRDLVSPNKPIYQKSDNFHFLKISDIETRDWFDSWGCSPRKSLSLKMPDIPREYLADFVRGYFDGDGSVSLCNYKKTKNGKEYRYPKLSCYICSGSKGFISELNDLLSAIRFSPCFSKVKSGGHILQGRYIKTGYTWRVSFSDQSAIKFTNWTHYSGHKVSMPRKHDKIKQARRVFSSRPGLSWNK